MTRKPVLPPHPVMRDGKLITIRTVRDGECKWPLSDAKELPMCGNPVKPGMSFCEYHARIGYAGLGSKHAR